MLENFFTQILRLSHKMREFPAGALIFEREDPVTAFFSVQFGEVHLLRRQADGTGVILQRANSGAVLAEASLNSTAYHCAAVAVERSTLAVFKRADVQSLLETDPTVARALNVHLASEVQRARRRAEILSLRRVADRLDAWLVWNDDILPKRGLWHRIADEIGVSYEALYRELARRR
ncbi:MAG: Crp/Fnr family transcriptional regulator [Paracoccaceae bacterium]|jgi:CRP-like cAMP-binding protein